ncbi:MAG: restriction endonuclease [Candidatus Glassbacteria bacterium RIFCSPLOWO2_12_FULL_58_11]|uniref:Restriction endonuclease n=2 Tax=Candidatus Glassiibacteriota TaxID=1817805 RepID=A0A1F5YPW8_9BACT|nr:MAG: restriction endonuclease [Candidatus Glassbacteria bacterium GWA2_58_10]OGG02176.1 MAG: restriction endonuclease [Candidatus Glassbacteria bacterium RIFCSPLOWO2_12_FULL_58_11]
MQIRETYSHFYGLEFLLVHKPVLWKEIQQVIAGIDVEKSKTKISKEKNTQGKLLYSPVDMNSAFKVFLEQHGWQGSRERFEDTNGEQLGKKSLPLPPDQQKKEIENSGEVAIFSYNQTDFVKDRVAIEVQFGKYSFVAYDLFVKHLAFYIGDKIDVGIEILPMKTLQSQMSSGVAYYEGEFYNVVRQGRGVPAVPLVILGIEA